MSQQEGSVAMPCTQLEVDPAGWSGPIIGYPDLISSQDSPGAAAHCSDEEGEDSDEDPSSHSYTPSLSLLLHGTSTSSSQQHTATPPQQQVTWSQLGGPALDLRKPTESQLTGFELAGRFRLLQTIGHGSFGHTYKALDTSTGAEVAVKVAKSVAECRDPTKPAGAYEYCQFLQVEWQAYHRIMNAEGAAPDMGFPCMLGAGIHHWCPAGGKADDKPIYTVSFLALELVGPSLWDACKRMKQAAEAAFEGCYSDEEEQPRVPSASWIIKTGKGMLKALASVHNRGYIHRDVKTENFTLDAAATNDSIYLIDFGFSRAAYGYYSFRAAGSSYDDRCASFWGTPNYSSLASLMSYPQTPRDDLEALVYCLAEMHSPTLRLPWNNTLTTNAEAKDGWSMAALERMCKKKRAAWAKWCHQGGVPDYLVGYFDYITELTPQDVPDYAWLMMQLDIGLTGKPPSRAPIRQVLAADLTHGMYTRADCARHAIAKVAAAAAKILTRRSTISVVQRSPPPRMQQQQQRRSKRAAEVAQDTGPHKRMRAMLWQEDDDDVCQDSDDEQQQHEEDEESDQLASASLDAADAAGHCSPGALKRKLQPAWATQVSCSQTDAEE